MQKQFVVKIFTQQIGTFYSWYQIGMHIEFYLYKYNSFPKAMKY